MDTKLEVQASLVTREGFQKPVKLDRLEKYIRVPRFAKSQSVTEIANADQPPTSCEYETMEFVLEKYKEVKQKNGKWHIVAIYREL